MIIRCRCICSTSWGMSGCWNCKHNHKFLPLTKERVAWLLQNEINPLVTVRAVTNETNPLMTVCVDLQNEINPLLTICVGCYKMRLTHSSLCWLLQNEIHSWQFVLAVTKWDEPTHGSLSWLLWNEINQLLTVCVGCYKMRWTHSW